MTDPAFEILLSDAEGGTVGDSFQRRSVEVLAQKLDVEQWHMHDLMDAGRASEEDCRFSFAKARAASAVYDATAANARAAALDGLYEAVISIGDEALLYRTVCEILSDVDH